MLPSYPTNLTLQPSKRVVNPVISNLPNRSSQRNSGRCISSIDTTAIPHCLIQQQSTCRRIQKPLPAPPNEQEETTTENLYSNLDGLDNNPLDRRNQYSTTNHDPRSLIDVRQRLEEVIMS